MASNAILSFSIFSPKKAAADQRRQLFGLLHQYDR
jgi:hypothetical protein